MILITVPVTPVTIIAEKKQMCEKIHIKIDKCCIYGRLPVIMRIIKMINSPCGKEPHGSGS